MKKLLLLIMCILTLATNRADAIKIGLQTNVEKAYIGAAVNSQVIDMHSNKCLYTLEPMQGYEFGTYKSYISIKINGKNYNLKTDSITIKPESDSFVSAKKKWYRGHLILVNKGGKLTVINKINIENYIQGVVPAEMPSKWAHEAHKAQAIAARSYALANLGKRTSLGYDLKDTPEDQAYNGASGETEQTNNAVTETRGIVLVHNLQIIPAFYSASAGGQTSNSGKVWTKDLPYLRSVPSFDDNIKKNGHGIGMSQHGANNLALKGYNAYQILQYFYKDVKFARINQEYYNN